MNIENNMAIDIDNQSNGEQFLTFMLEKEECGLEILDVQEIKGRMAITPIPCTKEYVLGVVNLRGAIVPVIDLRLRFLLPPKKHTANTAIIIARVEIEGQTRLVGLVVDEVSEVYTLNENEIHESGTKSSSIGGDFVRGLGVFEEKLVILINLHEVVVSSLVDIPDSIEEIE